MSGHQNRLDIRVGIEIDLISVMGSKLTWFEVDVVLALRSNLTSFLCGGQNRLRFWVWAKNYLVLIYGSKVTWFLRRDRNWLGFRVRSENDLFSMWGSIDLVFVRVVEVDLVFVCWPTVTWFYCEHRTWLRFYVGGRNWLDFILGGQTWLDFTAGFGIDLVLVSGSKMTWF